MMVRVGKNSLKMNQLLDNKTLWDLNKFQLQINVFSKYMQNAMLFITHVYYVKNFQTVYE